MGTEKQQDLFIRYLNRLMIACKMSDATLIAKSKDGYHVIITLVNRHNEDEFIIAATDAAIEKFNCFPCPPFTNMLKVNPENN